MLGVGEAFLIQVFDISIPGSRDIKEIHMDATTGQVVSVETESAAAEAKEKKKAQFKVLRWFQWNAPRPELFRSGSSPPQTGFSLRMRRPFTPRTLLQTTPNRFITPPAVRVRLLDFRLAWVGMPPARLKKSRKILY
jgi:hypothetical protein